MRRLYLTILTAIIGISFESFISHYFIFNTQLLYIIAFFVILLYIYIKKQTNYFLILISSLFLLMIGTKYILKVTHFNRSDNKILLTKYSILNKYILYNLYYQLNYNKYLSPKCFQNLSTHPELNRNLTDYFCLPELINYKPSIYNDSIVGRIKLIIDILNQPKKYNSYKHIAFLNNIYIDNDKEISK